MMNAARFDPNKFVNLSFAYSAEMRRCEDATRICVLHLSNNWSCTGKGRQEGSEAGEVLGLLLECLRHSKTLASYDNLSYPSVEKCISKYRYSYSYR